MRAVKKFRSTSAITYLQLPASSVSDILTLQAHCCADFGFLSIDPPASWDPSGWPAFLLEVLHLCRRP